MNFVFDLDGTICFKGKPVSEKILSALETLMSQGHHVIFASARPIRDMLPVLNERFHAYTLIGGNGSLIFREGVSMQASSFTDQQLEFIKLLIDEYEAQYLIDGEWDYSYTGAQDHPILNNLDPAKLAKMIDLNEHKSVVKVLILSAVGMEEIAERLSMLDVVVHKHGKENVLDISPSNVHKGDALRKIKIKQGTYVAFGNDANDITMFKGAVHSVMIGHHEELAKYATESIVMDDKVEDSIVAKLGQLALAYA